MSNDEIRPGFREALSSAPSRLLSDEHPLAPGLPSDEYLRPHLWSLDLRNRMSPEMRTEIDGLTRDFLNDLYGPVAD